MFTLKNVPISFSGGILHRTSVTAFLFERKNCHVYVFFNNASLCLRRQRKLVSPSSRPLRESVGRCRWLSFLFPQRFQFVVPTSLSAGALALRPFHNGLVLAPAYFPGDSVKAARLTAVHITKKKKFSVSTNKAPNN